MSEANARYVMILLLRTSGNEGRLRFGTVRIIAIGLRGIEGIEGEGGWADPEKKVP